MIFILIIVDIIESFTSLAAGVRGLPGETGTSPATVSEFGAWQIVDQIGRVYHAETIDNLMFPALDRMRVSMMADKTSSKVSYRNSIRAKWHPGKEIRGKRAFRVPDSELPNTSKFHRSLLSLEKSFME